MSMSIDDMLRPMQGFLRKRISSLHRLSVAAHHYNTSLLYQIRRFKRLHDRQLFSLDDALFWGLTDPALATEETDGYLSREAATRLRARVNAPSAFITVNDKACFYRLCRENALPVPATFGVLDRAPAPARATRSIDFHNVHVDLDELPDGEIIAKPACGMKGIGLHLFDKRGNSFFMDGREMDAPALRHFLRTEIPDDEIILQRRLVSHPLLSELSGGNAVQSARIVTFLDSRGIAHILFARFKFVRKISLIDNFADGETGNFVADIDVESGRIIKVVKKTPGLVGLQPITHHPDTGRSLLVTLPCWHEAVRLSLEGARRFKNLRSLGWDIALTPEGPIILEANQEWEIFPVGPYKKPAPLGDWESLIR